MQRRRRECAVVHAVVHKHNKATSLYIQGSTCPWHRFTQSAVDAIAVAGPGLGAAMQPLCGDVCTSPPTSVFLFSVGVPEIDQIIWPLNIGLCARRNISHILDVK